MVSILPKNVFSTTLHFTCRKADRPTDRNTVGFGPHGVEYFSFQSALALTVAVAAIVGIAACGASVIIPEPTAQQ